MDGNHKTDMKPTADAAPPPSFLEAISSAAGPSGNALPVQPPIKLACVSLSHDDRIRFLNFSTNEIVSFRDALATIWPIQAVRFNGGAMEIKFKGTPWLCNGGNSRRLIKGMLQRMYAMGWVLQAAVDISKRMFEEGWSQPPS